MHRPSSPACGSRRRSSHGWAATSSSTPRAGRSPTTSRSMPARRISRSIRSRAGRSIPVQLGFVHAAEPAPCSGTSFCIVHEFQTWIARGATWTSPVIRVRDRRHRRAVDPRLPARQRHRRVSVAARASSVSPDHVCGGAAVQGEPPARAAVPRLGDCVAATSLAAAPPSGRLSKRWVRRERSRFPATGPGLRHDRRFQRDDRGGASRRRPGDAVREPGLVGSRARPTMQSMQTSDVAVLDENGVPATVSYGDRTGVIVSPYAAGVRQRIAQFMDEWQTRRFRSTACSSTRSGRVPGFGLQPGVTDSDLVRRRLACDAFHVLGSLPHGRGRVGPPCA